MLKIKKGWIVLITVILMVAALITVVVWAARSIKDGIDQAREEIKDEQDANNTTGGNNNGGGSSSGSNGATNGSVGIDIPTDPIKPLTLFTMQDPRGFARYDQSGNPQCGIQYKAHLPEDLKAIYDLEEDKGRTVNYKMIFAPYSAWDTVDKEIDSANVDWKDSFKKSTQKYNYVDFYANDVVFMADSGNGYGAYWELTFNHTFLEKVHYQDINTYYFAIAYVEVYNGNELLWRSFSGYPDAQDLDHCYSYALAAADCLNQNAVYRKENGDYLYQSDLETDLKEIVCAASYNESTMSIIGWDENGNLQDGWEDWFPTVSLPSPSVEVLIGTSATVEYDISPGDGKFNNLPIPVLYSCDIRNCFTYKDGVVTGYRTCVEVPLYLYIFGGEHIVYVTVNVLNCEWCDSQILSADGVCTFCKNSGFLAAREIYEADQEYMIGVTGSLGNYTWLQLSFVTLHYKVGLNLADEDNPFEEMFPAETVKSFQNYYDACQNVFGDRTDYDTTPMSLKISGVNYASRALLNDYSWEKTDYYWNPVKQGEYTWYSPFSDDERALLAENAAMIVEEE